MADGAGDGHLTLHASRAFFVIILRREREDISVTIVEIAMRILEVRFVVIHQFHLRDVEVLQLRNQSFLRLQVGYVGTAQFALDRQIVHQVIVGLEHGIL